MRRNRKSTILLLLGILALGLTLGYAYLNTTLNIDGTVNVSSANWDVYWDNIQYSSNNVTDVTTPATISTGKTEVTFNVNFSLPGDTYEFTVNAVNDGSIDAMVDVVTTGVYAANGITEKELPDYLEYTVTYSSGAPIEQNQLLEAGTSETYKVRVHYKEDINTNQLPSTADNYMFKIRVNYVQATSSATPIVHSQTVYTANIDWMGVPIYNGIPSLDVSIGQPLPSGITTYQTPELAMEAYKQIRGSNEVLTFLKHTISNNIVTESYVGFVITPRMAQNISGITAGTYFLKGQKTGEYVNGNLQCLSEYDDGNGNCISPDYSTNKEILLSAFGSSHCEERYNIECSTYYGKELRISVFKNGSVNVSEDGAGCNFIAGDSYCTSCIDCPS